MRAVSRCRCSALPHDKRGIVQGPRCPIATDTESATGRSDRDTDGVQERHRLVSRVLLCLLNMRGEFWECPSPSL